MEDLAPMMQQDQEGYSKIQQQVPEYVRMLQKVDPEEWPVFRDLIQPPAMIAVMGMTGAGKSTLIGALGGKQLSLEDGTSEAPRVGHDTESETQSLGAYVTWHNARKVIFIDTPGFDDPEKGDDKILMQIAQYLVMIGKGGQKLAAVIYVLPINNERYNRTYHHNQELFEKICGEKSMRAVSLVTTKWDRATDDVGDQSGNFEAFERRENMFETKYWRAQVEAGARLYRHSRKLEQCSNNLLDKILRTKGGISLLLEDQIVKQERLLSETDPGRYLKGMYADQLYDSNIHMKEQEIQDADEEIALLNRQQMPTKAAVALKKQLQKEWQQLNRQKAEADQEYADKLNEWTLGGMAKNGAALPAGAVGLSIGLLGGWGIAAEEGIAAGIQVGLLGGTMVAVAAAGVGLLVVGGLWAGQKYAQRRRRNLAGEAAMADNPPLLDSPDPESYEELQRSLKPQLRDSNSRLIEPRKYFRTLQATNREIFDHSSIGLASKVALTTAGQIIPVPALTSSSERALEISTRIERKVRASESETFTAQLYAILQCRNVLQRVIYNLHRLKSVNRIFDRLTIVIADRDRPQIARMRSIMLETIQALTASFVETCDTAANKERRDAENAVSRLTRKCSRVLLRLRLLTEAEMAEIPPALIWRLLVHAVDVAVVTYAGSHVRKLTDHFMPEALAKYVIPGPFALSDDRFPSFHIIPRRLQCLNGFLDDSEVWVFHSVSSRSPSQTEESLYLACRIEALADTWGPVSIPDEGTKDELRMAYCRLGAGVVVPWNQPEDLRLQDEEVYCHWMEEAQLKTADRPGSLRYLADSPVMVIGASSILLPNQVCGLMNSGDILARLRSSRRLLPYNATPPHEEIESRTQELITGVSRIGVLQGKIGRTLRPSVDVCSWKDAILSKWISWDLRKQDATPLFETLDTLIGLQISVCTNNARRVSLRTVLLTPSMRSCFRPDPSQSEDLLDYLDRARGGLDERALDRRTCPFLTLWRQFETHPRRRIELHERICDALQRLRSTGFVKEGTSGRRFYAYYGEEGVASYWRVTFPEAAWMQLLKDSVATACVAVVVPQCLISDQQTGRRCQAHRYGKKLEVDPTLETLLLVDQNQLPRGVRFRRHENRFLCEDRAIQQRWALETPSLRLRDIGIRCTGILDHLNGDGLATEWCSTLAMPGMNSSAIPLNEIETLGTNSLPPLRVFIT